MRQAKKVPLLTIIFKALHSKNLTITCNWTIYFQINQFSKFKSHSKAWSRLGFLMGSVLWAIARAPPFPICFFCCHWPAASGIANASKITPNRHLGHDHPQIGPSRWWRNIEITGSSQPRRNPLSHHLTQSGFAPCQSRGTFWNSQGHIVKTSDQELGYFAQWTIAPIWFFNRGLGRVV